MAPPRNIDRPPVKNPWAAWALDAAERAARAFAAGVVSVFTLDAVASGFNADTKEKFIAGLLTGCVSVIISFVGKGVGASDSASLLPADQDPPLDENARR